MLAGMHYRRAWRWRIRVLRQSRRISRVQRISRLWYSATFERVTDGDGRRRARSNGSLVGTPDVRAADRELRTGLCNQGKACSPAADEVVEHARGIHPPTPLAEWKLVIP